MTDDEDRRAAAVDRRGRQPPARAALGIQRHAELAVEPRSQADRPERGRAGEGHGGWLAGRAPARAARRHPCGFDAPAETVGRRREAACLLLERVALDGLVEAQQPGDVREDRGDASRPQHEASPVDNRNRRRRIDGGRRSGVGDRRHALVPKVDCRIFVSTCSHYSTC
jgi:hypothetical protein